MKARYKKDDMEKIEKIRKRERKKAGKEKAEALFKIGQGGQRDNKWLNGKRKRMKKRLESEKNEEMQARFNVNELEKEKARRWQETKIDKHNATRSQQ